MLKGRYFSYAFKDIESAKKKDEYLVSFLQDRGFTPENTWSSCNPVEMRLNDSGDYYAIIWHKFIEYADGDTQKQTGRRVTTERYYYLKRNVNGYWYTGDFEPLVQRPETESY
ncbi:hypothetical protein [Robertmurraya massiliosenegalensis]|uniref:hypothetical protein n=1 Tax=Robertmurraya massiliosenegalensis TaxID=1287657 RepID=UPI00036FF4C4|nr:hypothetical protein [Robertmurraya massiliosenegalensis]